MHYDIKFKKIQLKKFYNYSFLFLIKNSYWIVRIVSKTQMEEELEKKKKKNLFESSDDDDNDEDGDAGDFPSQDRSRNIHQLYSNASGKGRVIRVSVSEDEEEEEKEEEVPVVKKKRQSVAAIKQK